MEEMKQGVNRIVNDKSDRPILLEVFTDIEEDNEAVKGMTLNI